MKENLTKSYILKYLEEINKKLSDINKYGEINMCGGAVMTLVYNSRASTQDIDAYFKPKDDMKDIIDEIARENNLDNHWLNDDVSIFSSEIIKDLQTTTFLNYSNLTVNVMNARSMLYMKLYSARERTKDMEDAIFLISHLNIKSIDEIYAITDKFKDYIHPRQFLIYKRFAERAFEEASNKNKDKFLKGMDDWKAEISNIRANKEKYNNTEQNMIKDDISKHIKRER